MYFYNLLNSPLRTVVIIHIFVLLLTGEVFFAEMEHVASWNLNLSFSLLNISIISGSTADGCNARESSEYLPDCVQMVSFCWEGVWLMYSWVKLKSTAIHNSSSENRLPAKTGEAPEICSADLRVLDMLFLPTGLRKSCPSLLERRILSTLSDNCVQISNWKEEGSLWVANVSALTSVFEMQLWQAFEFFNTYLWAHTLRWVVPTQLKTA